MVLKVQDPDSSPSAFYQAGGQSQSLDEWQNGYSFDTVGTVVRFRKMITRPKASMIRFQNPIVVPTV
jgi:hypothetical protein